MLILGQVRYRLSLAHRVRKGIRIEPPAGARNFLKNPRTSILPESAPDPVSL